MLTKLKAWMASFKAGWIANGCKTGCVIDDEYEVIRPCMLHASEIARLSKISEGW